MSFNPFWSPFEDSSDQSQAKQKQNWGDMGRASKVPRTHNEGRDIVVPPTESELEAVPILRNGKEKGWRGKRVCYLTVVDVES